jgi:hypothetical protein
MTSIHQLINVYGLKTININFSQQMSCTISTEQYLKTQRVRSSLWVWRFFHPDPFFRRPKSLGAEPTAKACGKLVQTLTYEIYPLGEDAGYVAPWTCGEIIGATFSHGLSSLPNGNLQRNYEKN